MGRVANLKTAAALFPSVLPSYLTRPLPRTAVAGPLHFNIGRASRPRNRTEHLAHPTAVPFGPFQTVGQTPEGGVLADMRRRREAGLTHQPRRVLAGASQRLETSAMPASSGATSISRPPVIARRTSLIAEAMVCPADSSSRAKSNPTLPCWPARHHGRPRRAHRRTPSGPRCRPEV